MKLCHVANAGGGETRQIDKVGAARSKARTQPSLFVLSEGEGRALTLYNAIPAKCGKETSATGAQLSLSPPVKTDSRNFSIAFGLLIIPQLRQRLECRFA